MRCGYVDNFFKFDKFYAFSRVFMQNLINMQKFL